MIVDLSVLKDNKFQTIEILPDTSKTFLKNYQSSVESDDIYTAITSNDSINSAFMKVEAGIDALKKKNGIKLFDDSIHFPYMDLTSSTHCELLLNNEINKYNFFTGYIVLCLEKGRHACNVVFDLTTFVLYVIYNNYMSDDTGVYFNLLQYNGVIDSTLSTTANFENYEMLYMYIMDAGSGNTKLCLEYMSNVDEDNRLTHIRVIDGKLY